MRKTEFSRLRETRLRGLRQSFALSSLLLTLSLAMARCEEGYLCDVCSAEVAELRESDLYLRYVLGEVDIEQLHALPERHLTCNPVVAQFIVHDEFPEVKASGPMAKSQLDPQFVLERTERVTAAFVRLLELDAQGGDRDVTSYPLTARARRNVS